MFETLEELSHLKQFLDTCLIEEKLNSSPSDYSHQLTHQHHPALLQQLLQKHEAQTQVNSKET